jgi:two-component system sensor kinase FixL
MSPYARREPSNRLDDQGLLLTGRMMHVSRLATIGEMASGVAHELNQPLAAIANYAQASVRVLNHPEPDMADIREALQEIASQAVRAGDIIRRMRNLVRQDPAERVPTDASSLVEEMIDLLQADTKAHDTHLRLDLQPKLPPILVERVQIQHVLLNLIRNAMEALADLPPSRREIVIGTQLASDGAVEIYVADNGQGILPAVQERLLEPFFTTKRTGTGLGLAISNTIVRAHDGTFGHRPNTPSGTCFYLRISPISVTDA